GVACQDGLGEVTGPGRRYVGFSSNQTTACQRRKNRAVAASLGHAADQIRRAFEGAGAMGTSRASMPASSTSRVSDLVGVVVGMAAHLLAKTFGDFAGDGRHFGRLEATGPLDIHGKLVHHTAGTAGEHE